MYAAVATTSFLLIVNFESKQVIPVERHRTEYYGVSWFAGQVDLVLSHSGIDNISLVDIESYARSEVGWISMGETATIPILSQPHQILCASDGRVVCTNTGRNSILIFDISKPGHFQEARISPQRWDCLSPDQLLGDHINSVFERSGRLYAIAHRYKKGSLLATFSYPDMDLLAVEDAGCRSGLHNILITREGQRISCHSEAGALVDLNEDAVIWDSGSPIYVRGLAASTSVIVVGESAKTGRDLRRWSYSGLWIIDRQSWRTLDYISLGPYGAVHEVRLLDVPDEAHHGHIFAGISLLAAREMGATMARQRVASATAARDLRRFWAGYKLAFGSPVAETDGYRVAAPDDLCLAIQGGLSPDAVVEFDYMLPEKSEHAHVSAVVGYEGSGADTQMTALLLQAVNGRASFSIWRNDEDGWWSLPETGLHDLPLSGRLRVLCHCGGATVLLDEKAVLELSIAQIRTANGRCGIRWLGSRVRPRSTGAQRNCE